AWGRRWRGATGDPYRSWIPWRLRFEPALRIVSRVLSLLPLRTPQPRVPQAPLRGLDDRDRACDRGRRGPRARVAVDRAPRGVRIRLDRALRLREEPPGHVPVPALEPDGRLGDVLAAHRREDRI